MTQGSLLAFPRTRGFERVLRLGLGRIAVAVLLGLLAVGILCAAAARLGAPALSATGAGVASVDTPRRLPGESTEGRRLGTARWNQNIDALAGVVAKKYRISQDATRELIGAAYAAGARIGVDPLLIVAVMAVESRFNPIAQSDGGAMGLMQVIPRYHPDKLDAANRASVLDPHTNIEVGARILKEYIGRGGTEVAGLQLYNGALGDASNAYSNRVLGEKQWLQEAMRRSRPCPSVKCSTGASTVSPGRRYAGRA
jgi:soluble lytic murein transglycosylase-like protein